MTDVIAGVVFMLAALANLLAIPHPIWFWAAAFTTVPPAAWLGGAVAAPAGGAPAMPARR